MKYKLSMKKYKQETSNEIAEKLRKNWCNQMNKKVRKK